jgi:hypothetical protein
MSEAAFSAKIREVTAVVALITIAGLAGAFFGFLIHNLFWDASPHGWMVHVIKKHFAATIAVPLSAFSSLCVILTLKTTSGPIEFEAFGFKFQGASGPLIFWLLTFLGFIAAVNTLWDKI